MESSTAIQIQKEDIDFSTKELINEGWEGLIYLVKSISEQTLILKTFKKVQTYETIENITNILQKVNHPNISPYIGHYVEKENEGYRLTIIMEYYKETIYNLYTKLNHNSIEAYFNYFDMTRINKFITDTLSACISLESIGFYHTDPFTWNIVYVEEQDRFIFIDTTSIKENLSKSEIKKAVKELGFCYLSVLSNKAMKRFDFPKENKARNIIKETIKDDKIANLIVAMVSKMGDCEKIWKFAEALKIYSFE
jgi:serine/threonine protein kinase